MKKQQLPLSEEDYRRMMIESIQKNFSECISGCDSIELEDTGIIKVPKKGKKGDGKLHPLPKRKK